MITPLFVVTSWRQNPVFCWIIFPFSLAIAIFVPGGDFHPGSLRQAYAKSNKTLSGNLEGEGMKREEVLSGKANDAEFDVKKAQRRSKFAAAYSEILRVLLSRNTAIAQSRISHRR